MSNQCPSSPLHDQKVEANAGKNMLQVEPQPQSDNKHQTLGERMKSQYESGEARVDPKNAYMLRLDGKTFSKFTSKFEKPFDPRFTQGMVKTAADMVKHFTATSGYCSSDEITLVFPPVTGKATNHAHDGRKNKISTVAAGKCSTFFLLNILDAVKGDEELTSWIIRQAPCFDARLMEIPADQLTDVTKNIYWRSVQDCRKNTVSSWGRFILGTSGVHGLHSGQQIEEMLKMSLVKEKQSSSEKKSKKGDQQQEDEQQPLGLSQKQVRQITKLGLERCITAENTFDFEALPLYQIYGVFLKRKEFKKLCPVNLAQKNKKTKKSQKKKDDDEEIGSGSNDEVAPTITVVVDGQEVQMEEVTRTKIQCFEMKITMDCLDGITQLLMLPKLPAGDLLSSSTGAAGVVSSSSATTTAGSHEKVSSSSFPFHGFQTLETTFKLHDE